MFQTTNQITFSELFNVWSSILTEKIWHPSSDRPHYRLHSAEERHFWFPGCPLNYIAIVNVSTDIIIIIYHNSYIHHWSFISIYRYLQDLRRWKRFSSVRIHGAGLRHGCHHILHGASYRHLKTPHFWAQQKKRPEKLQVAKVSVCRFTCGMPKKNVPLGE